MELSTMGKKRAGAFTLIELLVVIAIIALLIGLVVPALGGARRSATTLKAMVGARSLMQAYVLYADDHGGAVIPAQLARGVAKNVTDEAGRPLANGSDARWLFRLAPYFDYVWAGTVFVDRDTDAEFNNPVFDLLGDDRDPYLRSLYPSFGINRRFVGGDYGRVEWLAQGYHVTRISGAFMPSSLLTFASSRFNQGQGATQVKFPGHFFVDMPLRGSTFDPSAGTSLPATAFGYVDARYQARAVVGLLDGHADTYKPEKLLDRRIWSDAAARTDDANWEP